MLKRVEKAKPATDPVGQLSRRSSDDIVIVVPAGRLRLKLARPKVKVRSEDPKARGNVARNKRARKLAHAAMASGRYRYGGRWLGVLIGHGYLTEAQADLEGRAFAVALAEATSRLVADVEAGKVVLTR